MQSFVMSVVVLSIPAVLLGLFRRRLWWPLLVWDLGMILGEVMGLVSIMEFSTLLTDTGLILDAQRFNLWMVWSILVGSAIRISSLNSRESFALGVCFGALGSGLILSKVERKSEAHYRRVCLAMAGSLLHPGLMFGGLDFLSSGFLWLILWIPMLLWFWLSTSKLEATERQQQSVIDALNSINKTEPTPQVFWYVAALTLFLSFLLPVYAVWILGGTSVLWLWVGRDRVPLPEIGAFFASLFAVNLAVAGGLPEVAAWGLEELPMEFHPWLPIAMVLVSTVLSVLIGVVPMTIFGLALFARSLDLPSVGLQTEPLMMAYGIGLTLGNVRPLILNQVWRKQAKLWLLGVLVSSIVVGFLLGL